MKKEEILEANRRENMKKDVYELAVEAKAYKTAAIVMFFQAMAFLVYELGVTDKINYAFYSFVTISNAVIYGYKAIKLEKGRKNNAFVAICWTLITIILFLRYFKVI